MTTNDQTQFDFLGKAAFIGSATPYIMLVTTAAVLFITGFNIENTIIRDGMKVSGGVLGLLSLAVGILEVWHKYDALALRLDLIRKQNGLEPSGHVVRYLEQKPDNASSAPTETKPMTVWLGQPTDGGSILKRYDIKPDERPTQQFIEWVKRYTENNPRRRVPEREAMAMEEYASHANTWLSCMDRVGVTEREDERTNAARRWKSGISLANALAIFGYRPEAFLPKDGDIAPPAPDGVIG